MIKIRLNEDLSFRYLSKHWSLTDLNYSKCSYFQFVSDIDSKMFVVYGGRDESSKIISGGVLVTDDEEFAIQ